ncbi:MAG: peptidylprolyl isomerase [Gammaproteobacteria bacterium]
MKRLPTLALCLIFSAAAAAADVVVLETSQGPISIELMPEQAPLSSKNFLEYVRAGHYDGTIFHRVIADFMIQGGGFDAAMKRRETRPPIQNEADNGLTNDRGTVAMARTQDPHSASAQFFINVKDNDFLNHRSKDLRGWGYAVFGRVVDGMDVVDAIATTATGTVNRMRDVPLEAVVIERARVETPAE